MSNIQLNGPLQFCSQALEPGRGPEWFKAAGEQYWQNQDRLLNCLEGLTTAWFARRHEGTRAAQTAVVRMCSAESPLDLMTAWQNWANGASGRLVDDAIGLQQYGSVAAAALFERVSSPMKVRAPMAVVARVNDAA